MKRRRLALLISGRGSNMAAILAAAGPDYPAEPVLVLSDRADAARLEVAAARGVPTAVVESRGFKGDRAGFEAAMEAELARHGV
ncbi:MAG: formyltransferase family protein, partial [Alphaproteobacteria bacterium]